MIASLLFIVLLCAGCDGTGWQVGPCDVRYESPLLAITEARATSSNQPIGTVLLTDFAIAGQPVNLQYPGLDEGTNVAVEGDTLRCTVPCSFGVEQGRYAFTATAPGYASQRVRLGEVTYANREEIGPCPRIIFSGSQDVSLRLRPSEAAP